ncbi:MAG: alpha/beta hydrolase [Mycobacteriales bacterium]
MGSASAGRGRLWATAGLSLALGLVAGCSGAPSAGPGSASVPPTAISAATPSPSGGTPAQPAYYRQKLGWKGCGDGFSCATLHVPLDYTRPTGRSIDVAVVRLPAAGPGTRIGSLVINPGGPGGSGVDYARFARYLFPAKVRARFDVVGFDPRGVSRSTPVRCLSDRELDALIGAPAVPRTPAETAQLVATSRHFAAACQAKNGELLAHVGTLDTARDMDVLRAALGDAKLTYLGKSYGTYLGAKYAELFPGRVRALALDGALDPALTGDRLNAGQAGGFEANLRDFLTTCVRDGGCPLGSTQAGASAGLDSLLATIERSPLPATGSRRLGPGPALFGLAAGLYSPENGWPRLESALAAAKKGDGAKLLALADGLADRGPDGHYSNELEANSAVNCIDRPWPVSLPAIAAQAGTAARAWPHFGAGLVYSSLPCAYWPVPPVEQPHPVRAQGAPPILVVGTRGDPATPYVWSQSLARQLESGVLVTFEGDGHTAYGKGSTCVDDAVNRYLIEARAPSADTVCH